jgi:polysaccharide export outer membrane protein
MAVSGGLRFTLRAALVMLVALALSACSTRGGKVPYAPADFGPPDRSVPADLAYDLPLGPLDMLKVTVFRVPELSGDYQVDARGHLDMPLIGSISVRDTTPQQLGKELESRYAQRYLNNPEITVRVTSSISNNVTVEGGVNSPGIYSLPGKITLVGAIALARGVNTTDANPRRVLVFRKSGGKTMAAAFDLIAIRRGEMEDPAIYPGDTVVVDSSTLRPLYRDLIQAIPLATLFTYL